MKLSKSLKQRSSQLLIIISFLTFLKITGGSYLPSATEILNEFTYFFTTTGILSDLGRTAFRVYISVMIALVLGIIIGTADYFSKTISDILNSLFYPVQFISEAVLVITVIAVMGINSTVIYLVTILVILPDIFIATQIGIKNIDEEMLELGKVYTDDKLSIFKNIVLPQVNSYIFAGLIRAHATAWEIVATAEVFLALNGIGYLIQNQFRLLNLPKLFSLVLLLLLAALASDRVLRLLKSILTVDVDEDELSKNRKLN